MTTTDYARAAYELRRMRHELQDLRLTVENLAHARYLGWRGVTALGLGSWVMAQLEAAGFRIVPGYYTPAILIRYTKN